MNRGGAHLPPGKRRHLLWLVVVWMLYAGFSGWHLGHYALWDDEATTALFAQSVWDTGDTSAWRGDNLIAYRHGAELNAGWKARYVSPLQYYLAAPFVGWLGATSFAARLPFWLCGLLTFALVLRRLWQHEASPLVVGLWAIGWFGTVSVTLYMRNARYYALTLLCSVWFVDVWRFAPPARRSTHALLGLTSALTFIANYLNGVALVVTFVVQQLCAREGRRLLKHWRFWGAFGWPHLVLSLPVAWIWYPLDKPVVPHAHTWQDRWTLVLWNLRDFNAAEFAPVLVLLVGVCWEVRRTRAPHNRVRAAPGFSFLTDGLLPFVTYCVVIALLSPQSIPSIAVARSRVADVRYLVPLMPLGILWCVEMAREVGRRAPWRGIAVMVVVTWTSLGHGVWHVHWWDQCHALAYLHEIVAQYPDPYRVATEALHRLTPPGALVAVSPETAMYPILFHAAHVRVMHQLVDAPRAEIPRWHFVQGNDLPEWIVTFCAAPSFVQRYLDRAPYRIAEILDIECAEHYRPEILWRRFTPPARAASPNDGIVIYAREHTPSTGQAGQESRTEVSPRRREP
jgi:hypothetical protein